MNLGWQRNRKKVTGSRDLMRERCAGSSGNGQGSVQALSDGTGFSLGWDVKQQEDGGTI